MRRWKILALAVLLVTAPACMYSNIKVPLDTDLHETQMGDKVGESTYRSVLWLFAWGDAGTDAAAREGGITTLRHMDQQVFLILFGLYRTQTTIVYGD